MSISIALGGLCSYPSSIANDSDVCLNLVVILEQMVRGYCLSAVVTGLCMLYSYAYQLLELLCGIHGCNNNNVVLIIRK